MSSTMHMKLNAIVTIFTLVMGALLSGCATAGQAAGTTLRIWYSTDDPVERAWVGQLATRYQALHRNVSVQLTAYSFEDINTKLQLALSAGDPPDLAYVTPRGPGIPVYLHAHQLRDLNGYARAHHWAQLLHPGLLAAYNQPFGSYGAPRGHIMAAPSALAAVAILYNKQIMQRLHLSVPSSLASFEVDLVKAKRAGYVPLGLGNEDGWLGDDWYLTLVNALVPPAQLEPEQHLAPSFSFTRPQFQQAAATLQRWARAGYFSANFGSMEAQEGLTAFFRGKTLFQLVSSSENSQVQADEQQTHLPIDVFAFPGRRGRVMPYSGYLGWVVPARSKEPAEAESFISFMLQPNTASLLLRHGLLPAALHASLAGAAAWQQHYEQALDHATPGIYLDAAPISNLNATMEANVQLLLQGYEPPSFLVHSLEEVYKYRRGGSTARIDGEF